jgi:type III pantothenate kinase
MYLIIDIGNTRVKAALFNKGEIQEVIHFDYRDFDLKIKEIHEQYKPKQAIISAVGRLSQVNKTLVNKLFKCVELNTSTKLNFENKYATPTTLGVDRIALTASAIAH